MTGSCGNADVAIWRPPPSAHRVRHDHVADMTALADDEVLAA